MSALHMVYAPSVTAIIMASVGATTALLSELISHNSYEGAINQLFNQSVNLSFSQ